MLRKNLKGFEIVKTIASEQISMYDVEEIKKLPAISNDKFVGLKFNYLTVVKREFGHKRATYVCECVCGKIKKIRKDHLVGNKIQSCGCKAGYLMKEKFKKIGYISPLYRKDNYAARTKIFSRYKRDAAERGMLFTVSFETFIEIALADCFYCGKSADKLSKVNASRSQIYYTGVDRKDNSIGYVDDNLISCCTQCNMIKGSSISFEEMIQVSNLLKKLRSNNGGLIENNSI